MTATHTPGRWETQGTVIWSPDAKAVIAQVSELRATDMVRFTAPSIGSPDYHEIMANAKLIAAAPELKDALETLIEQIADDESDHCEPDGTACHCGLHPAVKMAKGLIAKIDGVKA